MTAVHLRAGDTDVVVDLDRGVPVIAHWGRPIAEPEAIGRALELPVVGSSLDAAVAMSVVPEHGSGWDGRPGLHAHRADGRDWSPRFRPAGHDQESDSRIVVRCEDPVARLALEVTIELADALVVRASLENRGDDELFLDALTITLPVPEHAAELLTMSGRWTREFQVERGEWPAHGHLVENRRGRTSLQSPPVLAAGTSGFGEWDGEVWLAHLAWSGNHSLLADRLADGRRFVQLGELLHPGEVVVPPGGRYETPEVVATHSAHGLTPASWGMHRHLRVRTTHPRSPRPVLLNTWEAVYFDHEATRLRDLASVAAEVGIERFVLDDGWFGSRRDDSTGLGDWHVSAVAHPEGLAPLIEHVRGLGMEFGIWVEPEMVSPDSDLYRAHPEWALTTEGYEPLLFRHQLVLDLGRPEAYAHVRDSLDTLLRDHDISFVKWDMNRDHVQGSGAEGAAGTHAQTLAVYGMLDELGAAHPHVEFESCSSGGGRVDHEILRRTQRIWTSDSNDALDRQIIQRGVSLFVPPELMGAHIGPPRVHTTGRVHTLAFQAATAMFGHLGVERDVLALDDLGRADLAEAIVLHKRYRDLLHGGDTVRFDVAAPYVAHGVYSADRAEGLVSVALLASAPTLTPPPVRLRGLDPERRYHVEHVRLPGERWGIASRHPAWLGTGLTISGRDLDVYGLRPPVLLPESAVLFHLAAAE